MTMRSLVSGTSLLQSFARMRINGVSAASSALIMTSHNSNPQFPFTMQTRGMSRIKYRRTHPKFVWPVKRRERHDEELTPDNQDFVKQVAVDTYGPPAIPESTGMPYVSPLKDIIQQRGERTKRSVRTGVIARKIGVYPIWDKNGKRGVSTLLQIVDNHVIRYIPPEIVHRNYGDKFGSLGLLLVGAEGADPQVFTKEYCGLFTESGVMPKVKLARFTITPEAMIHPGTPLYASHFQVGQYVDVAGKTIERGFQGVMKRWKFHGMPATHGVTKSHRRGGCIGGGGEKGRVWPGTKMPGHMGSLRRTARGLQILRINTKYNIIYVNGASPPGEINSFVTIRDSFFRHRLNPDPAPPFPTYYPDESTEVLPEDIFYEKIHNYSEPTIMFEEKR